MRVSVIYSDLKVVNLLHAGELYCLFSVPSEFQDSNLSPALPLLPGNAGMEHMFTEYSLFEQSDNAFAPLR